MFLEQENQVWVEVNLEIIEKYSVKHFNTQPQ